MNKYLLLIPAIVLASPTLYLVGRSADSALVEQHLTESTLRQGMKENAQQELPSMHAADTGSTLNLSIPVKPEKIETQARVELWATKNAKPTLMDGIPAVEFKTSVEKINSLHVGQQVDFVIPNTDQSYKSKIVETSNIAGVKTWHAEILNAGKTDNLIFNQGSLETHIVISTDEGISTVIVDNKTGHSVLIKESDIARNMSPDDDFISVDIAESKPPI